MRLLAELWRSPGLNPGGRVESRRAVRAVVLRADLSRADPSRGQQLLMVYSPVNRDYKFPGGGIEAGETHRQSLRRELAEESGAGLDQVLGSFGKVIEYDLPLDPKSYDLFCMTSYYYLCRILPTLGETRLDDYEYQLGFHPVWVEVSAAVRTNLERLQHPAPPLWTLRETFVLQQVQQRLQAGN